MRAKQPIDAGTRRIRVRQTSKFCEPTAHLDRLAKLSSRSNGVEGRIEPEIKRC